MHDIPSGREGLAVAAEPGAATVAATVAGLAVGTRQVIPGIR
ncbi:MAG TPA: hypothetical protein VLX31_04095 [Streptosporangiaceae bacterium]|nr:hypothetical protein [Streptosporangiaceae bacterium]